MTFYFEGSRKQRQWKLYAHLIVLRSFFFLKKKVPEIHLMLYVKYYPEKSSVLSRAINLKEVQFHTRFVGL